MPVVLAVVFIAAIQRNGSAADNDEAARLQVAEAVRIAKDEEKEALLQLVTDKAEVAKNCEIWGPKCTLAKNA